MLRVPLHKIERGMVLARPIASPRDSYRYLLQRDLEIPLDLVPRLKELGIGEVWVRCRDLEFLEELIDEDVTDSQRDVYHVVRRNFESIMTGSALGMDLSNFTMAISDLFHALKGSPHGNILLEKLDAFDNYLMSHSTNVCYLALLVGLKLERYLMEQRSLKNPADAKDLQALGLGCILHDVGKMRIPDEILYKPGKLTPDEMDLIRLHPVYGYEMVKGRVSAPTADVVLNHHQRWDGNGYPQRIDSQTGELMPALSGTRIPIFSRVATVADVFDAATTHRCYSNAKLPVQALFEMRTICKGFFDPVVEKAFYEITPPFPIGQVAMLSNGVEAVVVDFNPRHPTAPKVQGLRDPRGQRYREPSLEEIDLAFYPDLHIASIDGVDVTPYLSCEESPLEPTFSG